MPARPRVDRIKTVYTAAKGLNNGWKLRGFLDEPLFNGINSYIPQLHRVTIRYCKKSEDSSGMRNFIEHCLPRFAEENPSIAMYCLPIRNSIPSLRAEYANGREVQLNASNMEMEDVELYINLLRTRSGNPIVSLEGRQTSYIPSVQGMWNPFINVTSRINKAQLPVKELSECRTSSQSATDYVRSLVKEE
ncbi:hypothetical protein AB6A40_001885 [Gnathostoma spinigerum]|uniref:Large ribosomal subunit protein mL43 n=1 Tax=Gnathostoma spinigerum TaxID=75299 RepID=A0ABD6ECT3_9BILA